MRVFLALMCVVGGLAIVGGVPADTGALPAPLQHDTYYTWPGAQLLQVTTVPWGGGYVRNFPLYYVDCPFACIRPFDVGATVTLEAFPTPGHTFLGWQVADHGRPAQSGACPGTGGCTLTIDQAKDVVALFTEPIGASSGGPNKVTLTVHVTGSGGAGSVTSSPSGIDCSNAGSIDVTCKAKFSKGTAVDLTATSNQGSSFVQWEQDCTGTDPNSCSVTMKHDHTVTADFAIAE
jgi:hypothetical protein